MGVIHGIRAFLPHVKAHGEDGHIINTASLAGLACVLRELHHTMHQNSGS
ncbi:hypothetical protein [Bradyrhizobium sp. AZCC 1721]